MIVYIHRVLFATPETQLNLGIQYTVDGIDVKPVLSIEYDQKHCISAIPSVMYQCADHCGEYVLKHHNTHRLPRELVRQLVCDYLSMLLSTFPDSNHNLIHTIWTTFECDYIESTFHNRLDDSPTTMHGHMNDDSTDDVAMVERDIMTSKRQHIMICRYLASTTANESFVETMRRAQSKHVNNSDYSDRYHHEVATEDINEKENENRDAEENIEQEASKKIVLMRKVDDSIIDTGIIIITNTGELEMIRRNTRSFTLLLNTSKQEVPISDPYRRETYFTLQYPAIVLPTTPYPLSVRNTVARANW